VTIWLQGGPGSPSIDNALNENGPCNVGEDSNTTVINPWSWNNVSNILYIDQPAQTGFTYDEIVDGVLNAIDGSVDVSGAKVPLNVTSIKGKFSSQDPAHAVNTTDISARAIYHFVQAWFHEFKEYRRDNIHVWTQSYGGHYGPAIASLFMQEKNPATRKLTKPGHGQKVFPVGIDTLGIINGLVDFLIQGPSLPEFATNNTYGVKGYSQKTYNGVKKALPPCLKKIRQCNKLQEEGDPEHFANNATVLKACGAAFEECWNKVYLPFDTESGRNWFDIAAPTLDPFIPWAFGFLNNKWVQDDLGVKVNYSHSPVVSGGSKSLSFLAVARIILISMTRLL
jgi:carboxypeptidase C (cathepsin A)